MPGNYVFDLTKKSPFSINCLLCLAPFFSKAQNGASVNIIMFIIMHGEHFRTIFRNSTGQLDKICNFLTWMQWFYYISQARYPSNTRKIHLYTIWVCIWRKHFLIGTIGIIISKWVNISIEIGLILYYDTVIFGLFCNSKPIH